MDAVFDDLDRFLNESGAIINNVSDSTEVSSASHLKSYPCIIIIRKWRLTLTGFLVISQALLTLQ